MDARREFMGRLFGKSGEYEDRLLTRASRLMYHGCAGFSREGEGVTGGGRGGIGDWCCSGTGGDFSGEVHHVES